VHKQPRIFPLLEGDKMKKVMLAFCLMIAGSVICSAQQFTYYYPQIAAGAYEGGSWKTTIFITNAVSGGGLASGTIMLTKSDGSPYNITFFDASGQAVGSGNTIPFQLGAGETRKFVTSGSEPLSTGYATVTANAPVLGTGMFTQFDALGNMVGEAGIPAAIPLGRQAILVDTQADFKTGVAIANPNNVALHINFELVSRTGQIVKTVSRDLAPGQHIAFFIHELFPDAGSMVGRLQFYCANPMVSVGLRFEPSLELFTTLPPIAIQ
jgi:hypothetical protein